MKNKLSRLMIYLKKKIFFQTIICIIVWDFLMFSQIFLSPQVKRYAIITYKHDIYKFPHEVNFQQSIIKYFL